MAHVDNQVRDSEITMGYLRGDTVAKLGRDFKLSTSQINKIIRKIKEKQGVSQERVVAKDTVDKTERIINLDHVKIGNKLYNFRTRRGMSRADVAEHLSWSPKKIKNVEAGHTLLSLIDLRELAEYMNVSFTDLVEELA